MPQQEVLNQTAAHEALPVSPAPGESMALSSMRDVFRSSVETTAAFVC